MADIVKLQQQLEQLGLWNAQGPDGRYRYRYRLVPGEFRLNAAMLHQLHDIAEVTTAVLTGATKLSQMLERRYQAARVGAYQMKPEEASFCAMLKAACGGYTFMPEVAAVPPIVKVDLAWNGSSFQVVEFDSYNPRGLAYAFWLRYAHVQAGEYDAMRDNLLYALLERVRPGACLVWLYSDRERYYVPVLQAFAQVLHEFGVSVRIVGEHELPACSATTIETFLASDEQLLIVPDRMNQVVVARDALVNFAIRYPERVLVPFAPFLGAKGLLAFATNGNDNAVIATWQDQFLSPSVQTLVQSYVPSTALLGKRFSKYEVPDFVHEQAAVLKAVNSSGAKGVYMPGDAEYETVLSSADRHRAPNFIAQKLVPQQQVTIEGVDGTEQHFVRVTMYVDTHRKVCLDAEVTGTGDDPLVHGGPSCVQLPALF